MGGQFIPSWSSAIPVVEEARPADAHSWLLVREKHATFVGPQSATVSYTIDFIVIEMSRI